MFIFNNEMQLLSRMGGRFKKKKKQLNESQTEDMIFKKKKYLKTKMSGNNLHQECASCKLFSNFSCNLFSVFLQNHGHRHACEIWDSLSCQNAWLNTTLSIYEIPLARMSKMKNTKC